MQYDASIAVETTADVYRPSDDSFLLLAAVDVRPGDRFLEIGTGAGLIALHAAKVARFAVGTDVSPRAVRCARANAGANGLALAVVRCDLFRGLRGTFDVIAFNPPYLMEGVEGGWEERAWQGGRSGDDVILRFLCEAPRHLAPGGRIYLLVPANRERALADANGRFVARVAAKKPLFFETLLAIELRNPT